MLQYTITAIINHICFHLYKYTEMYRDSPPTEGSNRPKKLCSIKLKISLALQLYVQTVSAPFIYQ